ncbi:glycosyltransferase, partial [Actinomadura geliboluensis]
MIDVVLPCLNEAEALPWVLDRMPAGFRPLVVDNASTDGSARVAADRGARVVAAPERGFGAACHAGLLAAETDSGGLSLKPNEGMKTMKTDMAGGAAVISVMS